MLVQSPKVLERCSPKTWMPTEASALWYGQSGEEERTGESIWETVSAWPRNTRIGVAHVKDSINPQELTWKHL